MTEAADPPDQAGGSLPNAVYSKRTRQRRIAEGGETIGGTLRPDAARALRTLLEAGTYPSKLAAIEAALIREAERLQRRQSRAGRGPGTTTGGDQADGADK